jgi:pimeloyl-ACP methyl ester carboxylesterase
MTDPYDAAFASAVRLPSAPLAPRAALANDLRARLHRRLGLAPPADLAPMRRAVGLEYEVAGSEDGEAVLFMHAGTAPAYTPLMVEAALADHYCLVRYHRRGFAGSDNRDSAATIDVHVRDALALLEHLGIERAHIVGHSGSGVMALQLALDAPAVVRSLVLEEPAIYAIDERLARATRSAIAAPLARARAGDARGAMELWMNGIARTWRADLMRTVPGGPQQTLDDSAAFFADVEAVDAWEFDRARVAAIPAPVLFVRGAESRFGAIEATFRALVPQTEVAMIPGAGHMLHTDRPDLVASELSSFFARHSAST